MHPQPTVSLLPLFCRKTLLNRKSKQNCRQRKTALQFEVELYPSGEERQSNQQKAVYKNVYVPGALPFSSIMLAFGLQRSGYVAIRENDTPP
jgi:hypothetical protein